MAVNRKYLISTPAVVLYSAPRLNGSVFIAVISIDSLKTGYAPLSSTNGLANTSPLQAPTESCMTYGSSSCGGQASSSIAPNFEPMLH